MSNCRDIRYNWRYK